MRRASHDEDWKDIASLWQLQEDVTNLNHGSFGPPTTPVRECRQKWVDSMDREPMNFFVREAEPALRESRQVLAEFVGTAPANLAPVDNATYGMNVVAESFPLLSGEQVIINNHEYGAVRRIWERACEEAGAELVVVDLPHRFSDASQIVDPLVGAMNAKTRLLVVSHITSPTAVIFPVEELCQAAHANQVAVCIDGPHAIAQLDLNLDELACDFYTASCHKWLSAAFGSGFVYVHPKWQDDIVPPILSWGRLLPEQPESWDEEFLWRGTSNLSAFLTIPTAIELMHNVGLEEFRQRTHWLAQHARQRLEQLFHATPITPDDPSWYGTMSLVQLPDQDWSSLQHQLWQENRIEIPVIHFDNQWFIRVSCHLHTMSEHIDHLIDALKGV